MNINIEDYKYKYETHLHTKDGSACAHNTPVEMAMACKEAGYAGMFITNHAWGGNTCVDRSLPWSEWVHQFSDGYYDAQAWGDNNNFKVFFGYEAGYNATEFLIYGVTPEWMIAHPELHDATVEEQYELIHNAGGMVIQAHPFRDEPYIPMIRVYCKHIDGAETINATHSNHLSKSHNVREWNDWSVFHARRHNLKMTAGSDAHTTRLFGGGVITKTPLLSDQDYINLIMSDDEDAYLLTDGDTIYDRFGNVLSTLS